MQQPTEKEKIKMERNNELAELYILIGRDKTLTPLEKRRFRQRIWKKVRGEYHV